MVLFSKNALNWSKETERHLQFKIFQINAILLSVPVIKESWKMYHSFPKDIKKQLFPTLVA